MPASHLQTLRAMAYNNAWANHRLLSACAALTQEEFEAPRVGFFPSIQATLNHILTIDLFYVDALEGGTLGPDAWAIRFRARRSPELHVAQATVDRRLIAWCDALDENGPDRIIRVHRGTRVQTERADRLLLHLFQHDIHHRGQAHGMLSGTEREAAAARRVLLDRRGAVARSGVRGTWLDGGNRLAGHEFAMTNGPLGLEHPLVVSDNLDALAERYRAMGFAPTHKGYHPWGTGTQLVLFPDNFIELMGIEDHFLIDEPSETGFRFGRFIADQLNRREGIAMIALHSDERCRCGGGDRAWRGARRAGEFPPRGHAARRRNGRGVVSLAMLIDWEQPQLSHFICQQHRPEFVWVPEWMQHPNGAQTIERVVYAAAEPYALWQRFAGIWGEARAARLGNGFRVATAGGELLVLDRPSAEARFAPVEMPSGWRDHRARLRSPSVSRTSTGCT